MQIRSLLWLAALTGCPDRTNAEVDAEQIRVEYKDIPVTVNRDIDILFVIDDSPSMLDKQNNLKANFGNFINVLDSIEGGLPNIHLGVVTSDLGTSAQDGTMAASIGSSGVGGCSGTGKMGNLQTNGTSLVSGAFISDVKAADGSRSVNYTGTLADAFSAIASVGAGGCGFEQHLEAAKRALTDNSANAGFLRDSAFLAVIFIQDEDDCSMAHSTLLGGDKATLGELQSFRCNRFGHVCSVNGSTSSEMNTVGNKGTCSSNESGEYLSKVKDYVSFFKGLKRDPNNVIVSVIAGPTTPYDVELRTPPAGGTAIPAVAHSCSYAASPTDLELADPAIRMSEFLNAFPTRSTYSTVCQQDLSGALTQIAQKVTDLVGNPCIERKLADVDPATPGDQYDCSVSDVTNFGKANQTETPLPQCNNASYPDASTNKPCWSIEPDAMNCTAAPNQVLAIERDEAPAPDTHVISYCLAAP